MLMSRLYINITTTSYCADPRKVVPVFGLDAKFGNNSIPRLSNFPELRHIPTSGAFTFAGNRGKQTKPFAELLKT